MMGCFLPCFGASKRRKHLPSINATLSGDQTHVAEGDLKSTQLTEQKILEEPINNTQSKIKFEEYSNRSGIKKITFDLNTNANEELSTKEVVKKLEESNTEPEKAGHEIAPQINDGPKAIADNLEDEKKGEDEEEGEVNRKSLPEESSESLFSLSIDSRKQVSAAEKAEYEVDSPVPLGGAVSSRKEESGSFGSSHDGFQHVSSGLNPMENLAQGKRFKASKAKDSTDLFTIKLEGPSKWNAKRQVNFDMKVNTNEEPSAKELIKGLNENKQDQEETPQISECFKSIVSGKSSEFSHHRYRDCSDEECGDFDLDESDFGDTFVDDDADNEVRGEDESSGAVYRTWVQEESSESLFSLSPDSRKQVSAAEKAEHEVSSPVPARDAESSLNRGAKIQNVSSVLNPIENLAQGKVVKATATQPLRYEKENINLEKGVVDIPMSPEPSLKVSNGKARHKKFSDKKQEEIGVDTSLSSWLVETETTPNSKNSANSVGDSTPMGKRSSSSPVSHEDRPILGALTIEELRKFSVSTTPSRRSKSRSPDETPIIGTVGSYWSYTGQTINSESSSCGRIPKAQSSVLIN